MDFFESEFKELKYLIKYPKNFNQNNKYPVILFLHGAGSRKADTEVLRDNPFFKITDEHKDFPFVLIAPLCRENEVWFDRFETLKEFVLKITDMPFCDKERLYVMGASMGGYGTWQLAMSMPDYFAAIVPICGGGMYWSASRLKNIPVWAFHGAKDSTVKCEESEKMVNAVNEKGGNARLTIYPENMHDSWSDTYKNEEVFKWLLSHKNQNTKKLENEYIGSKNFG
ncbi:MAG: phospholipase [Ruminococcaceae bacterium]|nr:phospholipase [Oscillospiraceae bacterium]